METTSVLVTGGAGYIGSHVVLDLLDAGYRPVVLDDLSTGFRAAVPDEVPFAEGSILDAALLTELFQRHKIDAVIHLAASILVDESVAEPAKYYRNNTAGTLCLAEAALKAGIERFIFSSSSATYGTLETVPVSEDAPARPINPYGNSKRMAEEILRDIAAANPRFRPVALRYFNVAGADPAGRAGERGQATHLIRVAVEAALGLRPALGIYGQDYPTRDGTCERDYVHVSDVAAAHIAALRYLESGGAAAALNCGCGRGYTILEVVRALERETGKPLPTTMAPRRPGDPPALVSDVSRIKSLLDWSATRSGLAEIISGEIAWRRKLHGLAQ